MIWWFFIVAFVIVLAATGFAVWRAIRSKNMEYWLPTYITSLNQAEVPDPTKPHHVFIAVCDHWEPQLNGAAPDVAMAKVERWASEYPLRYSAFYDCDGRPPQHTFFFPAEEYRPEYIDRISELCRAGYGDVEIHLHHKDDTAEGLAAQLDAFRQTLFHRHGLLRRDPKTGEIIYAFIHGNWALCNSRPDGAWCGVDQELGVLLKTGCYADFTMPSAPNPTQTETINSIYYARDIPGKRKSHNTGKLARVGQRAPEGHLLMIQGPLTLDWGIRKAGVMPRIENGDVTAGRGMSVRRLKYWLSAGVQVKGQPNWSFIKLHTHGCHNDNINAWLGDEMLQFHRDLRSMAEQDSRFKYHYVTAYEMAQLVHQAEAGASEPVIIAPSARAIA